jgi:hypothetical protein
VGSGEGGEKALGESPQQTDGFRVIGVHERGEEAPLYARSARAFAAEDPF